MRKRLIGAIWAASVPALTLASLGEPVLAQSKSAGEILVDKHACKSCHLIKGDGGRVGPPLDGLGEHRSESYIVYKLTRQPLPRRKKLYPIPYELMAHVHVPRKDVAAIAQFLRSLPQQKYLVKGHQGSVPEDTPAGSSFKPDKNSVSSKRGMSLFNQKGCFACHSIDGLGGGSIGPSLDGVGARRSRNFIGDRVSRGAVILPEPNEKSGQVSMPPAQLNANEIKDITNWLMTLPVKRVPRSQLPGGKATR